jgi:hypothetical protein
MTISTSVSTALNFLISLPAIVIAFWITTTHFTPPTTFFGFIGAGIVLYLVYLIFAIIIGIPIFLLASAAAS